MVVVATMAYAVHVMGTENSGCSGRGKNAILAMVVVATMAYAEYAEVLASILLPTTGNQ